MQRALPQPPSTICSRTEGGVKIRPVSHRAQAWRRRHGRRLCRARRASRPSRRHQAPAPGQSAMDRNGSGLWREARTAASVNHPNICQLYEIDSDGDELFLAMELLDGEPLSARLARGALPAERSRSDRAFGARRARGPAPEGNRPSRSEAVEHLPGAARRQAARLRPRASRSSAAARRDRHAT